MTKKECLEKEVIDFVLQQSGDFHLKDILDALRHPVSLERGSISHKDIIDVLTVNAITFLEKACKSKIEEDNFSLILIWNMRMKRSIPWMSLVWLKSSRFSISMILGMRGFPSKINAILAA